MGNVLYLYDNKLYQEVGFLQYRGKLRSSVANTIRSRRRKTWRSFKRSTTKSLSCALLQLSPASGTRREKKRRQVSSRTFSLLVNFVQCTRTCRKRGKYPKRGTLPAPSGSISLPLFDSEASRRSRKRGERFSTFLDSCPPPWHPMTHFDQSIMQPNTTLLHTSYSTYAPPH